MLEFRYYGVSYITEKGKEVGGLIRSDSIETAVDIVMRRSNVRAVTSADGKKFSPPLEKSFYVSPNKISVALMPHHFRTTSPREASLVGESWEGYQLSTALHDCWLRGWRP